jgi:NTE family protein
VLPRPRASLAALRDRVARSGVAFDGRLRIVAVDRHSGRRVVFGSPGAPTATVAEAVEASCSVPWLFAPVRIGGREYVDGGVWSPTNLDIAPAWRDTHVLCLTPTGGGTTAHKLPALARGATRPAVALESLVLRHRGAAVRIIGPDVRASAAIGADLMDRSRHARVLAAGYEQGLAAAAPATAP